MITCFQLKSVTEEKCHDFKSAVIESNKKPACLLKGLFQSIFESCLGILVPPFYRHSNWHREVACCRGSKVMTHFELQ